VYAERGALLGAVGVVGVADGFGDAIATPLSQTNFFPDFTHVYFLLRQMIVCPTRVHFSVGT
jgi:hypothetical protein